MESTAAAHCHWLGTRNCGEWLLQWPQSLVSNSTHCSAHPTSTTTNWSEWLHFETKLTNNLPWSICSNFLLSTLNLSSYSSGTSTLTSSSSPFLLSKSTPLSWELDEGDCGADIILSSSPNYDCHWQKSSLPMFSNSIVSVWPACDLWHRNL